MPAGNGDGEPATGPVFTMHAYFEGHMKMEDFARTGKERPTIPHNVFGETLLVVDIAAIREGSVEERQANVATMLEAAKSRRFFRIANHGIPLEVVQDLKFPKDAP